MTETFPVEEDLPPAPLATRSSESLRTSTWRTIRPVIDRTRCTRCEVCWKFCPDVAIAIDADGWPSIRLDFCKGCGVCAEECRPRAIAMVEEPSSG